MVCFDTEYLRVELYENPKVLVTQWYGECTSKEYREALLRFIELVKEHDVLFAIADRRLLPEISDEDMRWTLSNYLAVFTELPLKRFAVLKSFNEDHDKHLSMFLSNEHYSLPFETKAFDDLTSAYDWVTAVEAH